MKTDSLTYKRSSFSVKVTNNPEAEGLGIYSVHVQAFSVPCFCRHRPPPQLLLFVWMSTGLMSDLNSMNKNCFLAPCSL